MSASAGEISVKECIELLDTDHATFAAGAAAGRYTFWLGSGISRGAVPGLDGVVQRVLEHLQVRIEIGNPDCRFRLALNDVIKRADLSAAERAGVDFESPVSGWKDLQIIVGRLVKRYADVLDVRVDGEEPDYLLWDAVDVRETYPAKLPPDCEHLCLAILGMEGVAARLVSPNWDGLIESAFRLLGTTANEVLDVAVLPDDLRATPRRVQLLKFHGCAVLAKENPATYRPSLVGRKSQITDWPEAHESAAMRQEMTALATTTPTLMVGLSAQDSNIQAVFSKAKNTMQWSWPNEIPAVVFAEDELGADQQTILRVVYGSAYDGNRLSIEGEALVRAYAKPLLVALMLDVLRRKGQALIVAADAPGIPSGELNELGHGLSELRDIAASAAGGGTLEFVHNLLGLVGRVVSLFQRGSEPDTATSYQPLTMLPVDQLATDPSLAVNGVPEFATALALLGRGQADARWKISSGPTARNTRGALRVRSSQDTALFFVATNSAVVELERTGAIESTTSDAVLIHSDEPAVRLARSASAPPGRTGGATVREVPMRRLLREATGLDHLEREFRMAAGL
jgi:hypothetical protein